MTTDQEIYQLKMWNLIFTSEFLLNAGTHSRSTGFYNAFFSPLLPDKSLIKLRILPLSHHDGICRLFILLAPKEKDPQQLLYPIFYGKKVTQLAATLGT